MKIKSYKEVEVGTGEVEPDFPNKFFDQILAFLGYGFCKCVWEYDYVLAERRELDKWVLKPVLLKDISLDERIQCPDGEGGRTLCRVLNIWNTRKEIHKVMFSNGFTCDTSMEHKYLCCDGKKHTLKDILKNRSDTSNDYDVVSYYGPVKVVQSWPLGVQNVVDIEVDHPLHCFYANGIAVSNSHAVSYSMYSAVGLWLKAYYPLEFMCANLNVTDRGEEKKGVPILDQRVQYCISLGLKVSAPDVRTSTERWIIRDGGLVAPLKNIKGFSTADTQTIIENRPYSSLQDFLDRTKLGKSKVESLIMSGALDCFGQDKNGREYLWNYYHEYYPKLKSPKKDSRQISLLDMLDVPEEQETFEMTTHFTTKELDDAFQELNGFTLQENLLLKYASHLRQNKTLKRIEYALSDKTNKHFKVFCKIQSATPFKSKAGDEFVKLKLTDGVDTMETVMRGMNYNAYRSSLKVGNVIELPMQKADNGGVYIDDLNKTNVTIIDRM